MLGLPLQLVNQHVNSTTTRKMTMAIINDSINVQIVVSIAAFPDNDTASVCKK